MPRVIVTTDTSPLPPGAAVLLDEQVYPIHLSNRHGAAQLAERIAWAVTDAEKAQRSGGEPDPDWPFDTQPVRRRSPSTRRRRRPNANVRATQQYTSSSVGA